MSCHSAGELYTGAHWDCVRLRSSATDAIACALTRCAKALAGARLRRLRRRAAPAVEAVRHDVLPQVKRATFLLLWSLTNAMRTRRRSVAAGPLAENCGRLVLQTCGDVYSRTAPFNFEKTLSKEPLKCAVEKGMPVLMVFNSV